MLTHSKWLVGLGIALVVMMERTGVALAQWQSTPVTPGWREMYDKDRADKKAAAKKKADDYRKKAQEARNAGKDERCIQEFPQPPIVAGNTTTKVVPGIWNVGGKRVIRQRVDVVKVEGDRTTIDRYILEMNAIGGWDVATHMSMSIPK